MKHTIRTAQHTEYGIYHYWYADVLNESGEVVFQAPLKASPEKAHEAGVAWCQRQGLEVDETPADM